jgi:hypothetical protein
MIDVTQGRTERAYVTCAYITTVAGDKKLAVMHVQPPIVTIAPSAEELGIARISWRVVVQVNSLDTLFSANWQSVYGSRRRFTTIANYRLKPLRIQYAGPTSATKVAHVVIEVRWYGEHGPMLGTTTVTATDYTDAIAGPIWPEGCHTIT